MKTITSVHNESLRQLSRLLSSAKARRESGQAVLEGVHLLDACLNAGGSPEAVYVPEGRLRRAEIQALLARLPEDKITVVSQGALEKISALSGGEDVMSLIVCPLQGGLPQSGDCVVLERVQDPGNVGTILRSAAACGIRQVIFGEDCVDVWSPKVLRAGMGAHFLLALYPRTDLSAWRAGYRDPVRVTALGGRDNRSVYSLDLKPASAWLFGNEGSGVSENMLDSADGTVHIPMIGATESLNVAMAATVCLFEQMRQRLHAQA